MLYRRFPLLLETEPSTPGDPLFAPRTEQGHGRHDNPGAYGALYLSRHPASPVAELIKEVRGRELPPEILLSNGAPYALAAIDDSHLHDLVDLDDPRNLSSRELRPSGVATHDRRRTRRMALDIHDEGVAGFEWWSTIEASWINVTLFAERTVDRLALAGPPEPLTVDHPVVREAADAVGVLLP